MSYQLVNVSPTATQIDKIRRGMVEKRPVKVTLSKKSIEGGEYPLMLTKAQHRKMVKSQNEGKGCGLNLTPKQLKETMSYSEVQGGGWFSSIGNFLVDNVVKPVASSLAGKYLGPAGSTAVNALSGIAKSGINAADKAITKKKRGRGVGGCNDGMPCPECEGTGFILPLVGALAGKKGGPRGPPQRRMRPPPQRRMRPPPHMQMQMMEQPEMMMREPKNYQAPPPHRMRRGGALESMIGKVPGPTALF